MGIRMLFAWLFLAVASQDADAQEFSLCGKTGNIIMTWEEFSACKKELVPTDKSVKVNTFLLMVPKAEKKDTVWIEFVCKGGQFSKSSLEMIEKLHKSKKMGNMMKIDAVELLQSGRDARKTKGITVTIK
jgi:hypothetical protein